MSTCVSLAAWFCVRRCIEQSAVSLDGFGVTMSSSGIGAQG